MSKTKVHVIIPYTSLSACGIINPYRNAASRDGVTCEKCKKSDWYKKLKRYR